MFFAHFMLIWYRMRDADLVSVFYFFRSRFPSSTFFNRLCSLKWMFWFFFFLIPLSRFRRLQVHRFISQYCILFYLCMVPVLYKYATVLLLRNQCGQKSGIFIHLALFFLLRVSLVIQGLLCFHGDFKVPFQLYERCHLYGDCSICQLPFVLLLL